MTRRKLSADTIRIIVLYLCIGGLLFWRAYNKGLGRAGAIGIGISVPLLAFLLGIFLKKCLKQRTPRPKSEDTN